MEQPPIPPTETERLQELYALEMLDTPAEEPFDGIVEVAAALFDVPIVLLNLMDADRQWFKANVGASVRTSARSLSFCAHTIMGTETLVVEDATQDARFATLPFVVGWPGIRFYAGAPLITEGRQCIGTLCILDVKPRGLGPERQRLLERMARQAIDALEMRKLVRVLAESRP